VKRCRKTVQNIDINYLSLSKTICDGIARRLLLQCDETKMLYVDEVFFITDSSGTYLDVPKVNSRTRAMKNSGFKRKEAVDILLDAFTRLFSYDPHMCALGKDNQPIDIFRFTQISEDKVKVTLDLPKTNFTLVGITSIGRNIVCVKQFIDFKKPHRSTMSLCKHRLTRHAISRILFRGKPNHPLSSLIGYSLLLDRASEAYASTDIMDKQLIVTPDHGAFGICSTGDHYSVLTFVDNAKLFDDQTYSENDIVTANTNRLFRQKANIAFVANLTESLLATGLENTNIHYHSTKMYA
jgi:hypothetical protein